MRQRGSQHLRRSGGARFLGVLGLAAATALGLCACGNGGSSDDTVFVAVIGDGVEGSVTADVGHTNPAQFVSARDGGGESFPGAANTWDLADDFQIVDGGDDQFDGAMALGMTLEPCVFDEEPAVLPDPEPFPSSSYDDLTWFTPLFDIPSARVGDGRTTGGVLSGDFSLYTLPSADTRVSQVLDLTAAVPPVELDYLSSFDALANDRFAGEPRVNRVVLRDAGGTLLETLYENDDDVESGALGCLDAGSFDCVAGPQPATLDCCFDLSAFAGQQVTLSFESLGSGRFVANRLDDASVSDDDGVEFVANGDFETGDLTSWQADDVVSPQTFQSAVWPYQGLEITRSFHTAPGSLYGRWVDVFTNPTGAAIDATAAYRSELGSDGFGIVAFVAGSGNQAISAWDGNGSDRDLAFVIGDAPIAQGSEFGGVRFLPDPVVGSGDGSDLVEWCHVLQVAPGGMATLVHFVVLDGNSTTSSSASARPGGVEAEAQRILGSFGTVFNEFSNGMTQAQLDSVVNL